MEEQYARLLEHKWITIEKGPLECKVQLREPKKRKSRKTANKYKAADPPDVYWVRCVYEYPYGFCHYGSMYNDEHGIILRRLRDCLEIRRVMQYDWSGIIPQPIAEELFSAFARRHEEKFQDIISLFHFPHESEWGIQRRDKYGLKCTGHTW
jgi:hypothetical protein